MSISKQKNWQTIRLISAIYNNNTEFVEQLMIRSTNKTIHHLSGTGGLSNAREVSGKNKSTDKLINDDPSL